MRGGARGAAVELLLAAVLTWAACSGAAAQAPPPIPVPGVRSDQTTHVQTAEEALTQDASEYALHNQVSLEEAKQRLRAQAESVAVTDRLQQIYRDRLAGISIEHHPVYRIVVLLTGETPVPDQAVVAGGMTVPIVFRTGAAATRDQLLAAIGRRQAAIQGALPTAPGVGIDPRTGELVIMIKDADAARYDPQVMASALTAYAGVPVRIRLVERGDANLVVAGGSRVAGKNPDDPRQYVCTTGFVVTDAAKAAIVTAAHCPDDVRYLEPKGGTSPLSFIGQWGARYQDVQIHASGDVLRPIFYVDGRGAVARTVTTWRNRASTRAGDVLCHRGARTGYSCAQVELVDYAPPATLCGGRCDPVWVTVTGPSCRGGDSGGPVFAGTVAFGIVKGASFRHDGTCNFYYYMSVDYLPAGWTLLREPRSDSGPSRRAIIDK